LHPFDADGCVEILISVPVAQLLLATKLNAPPHGGTSSRGCLTALPGLGMAEVLHE
jgi:hypothetical protein